ncbi:hypothetical protein R84B8_01873 [Treponema sp. R8-4-B8]
MKRMSLLLFIAFTLANAVLPAQETYDDYLEQGREHYDEYRFDAAISSFEAAKRLKPERPTVWKELADAYFMQGNYDEAIKNYNRAIQIYIEIKMENPEVYNHRGETYRSKGNYELAINDFKKAISLDNDDADAWNYLGYAYYGMGDYDAAIENFNKAIMIDGQHAQAWNNRAASWLEKGDYDKAIDGYTQLIKFEANYNYAIVYSNRSRAYRMKKEYQKALDDCDAALRIDRDYAPALNNRALAYFGMGQYKKALAAYRECLIAAEKSININDVPVYAWFLAGQVYQKYPYLKGGIKKHAFWSKYAVNVVLDGIGRGIKKAEAIRQNMGAQGAELMAQMIYLYYAGVDFEAVFGSAQKVFFYSESLRSRGFLEQVGTEAAIRLPGVSKEDFNKFLKLRATIDEQQAIINTYDGAKLEDEASNRYAMAIRERKKAEEELAELDIKLGKSVPKYNELRNPKPVTLSQAKAYCGKDRAVLEYVLWDNSAYKPIKGPESWSIKDESIAVNSYCLVITKNGLTAVPLNPDFNYADAIQKLRDGFESPNARNTSQSFYEEPRNALYNQLIKPVLPYLKNIKNITIVPDGDLALIPFDILRADSGSKNFGDNYVISLSPSISVSVLARKDEKMPNSPILFFANSVYAGRKTPRGTPWKDLGGVENEVNILQKVAGAKKKDFLTYFDEKATKKNIQSLSAGEVLKKYPIIHFACHGYFNREKPSESGLVLYQVSGDPVAENGYLTIPDVAALDLNARMVVLSACETGLGKAKIGEGMVGLVRAFMVAGAGNVGVSLWEIDDVATPSFMERLYGKTLGEGKRFSEAYKEVKKLFQAGEEFGSTYTKPYYWAAFTMYE